MAVILSFIGKWNGADLKKADVEMAKMRQHSEYNKVSLKNLGLAAATAGAAVGAMAIKIGTDAVKAAIDEEASVGRLTSTMKNLGFAMQDAGVEKFIDDMQYLVAFTDTDLRESFDTLLRGTKDVAEAERALGIAADIATAKQRPIADVANILSKAYLGNTMALGRMNVGVDTAILKSGDMVAITAELQRVMGGQAAAAANTFAGRIKLLGIGVDELSESLGQGLLKGFIGDMGEGKTSLKEMTDQLRETQDAAASLGETVGTFVRGALVGFNWIKQAVGAMVVQAFDLADAYTRATINFEDFLNTMSDEEAQRRRDLLDAEYQARHLAAATDVFGIAVAGAGEDAAGAAVSVGALGDASDTATGQVGGLAGNLDSVLANAKGAAGAVDALKTALDKLNGVARTVRETQADYFTAIRDAAKVGVTDATGKGKTRKPRKVVHPRLTRGGGLDLTTELGGEASAALDAIAQAAEERAAAILAADGKNAEQRAANALARGRRDVARQARGYGMSNYGTYLPRTPADLTQRLENQARAESTVTYVFNGDLNVASLPDAIKVAHQKKRLVALNTRGPHARTP